MPSHSPQAGSASVPARIERGRITEVNSATWVCRVRPDAADSDVTVSIPSLYSHPVNGEGIHFFPEVGAFCYICYPSDNQRRTDPFLLLAGAATAPKDYSEKGGVPGSLDMFRPLMSPGDINVFTRDGNGLFLKRGGITEIRGTSLAKILFEPRSNKILTISENLHLQAFGGSVQWTHLGKEEDPAGRVKTQYCLRSKEYASSQGCSVRVQMGNTDGSAIVDISPGTVPSPEVTTVAKPVVPSGVGSVPFTVSAPAVTLGGNGTRVVDFRVFADESLDESVAITNLEVGANRAGDLLVDSKGGVKATVAGQIELSVSGATPENKITRKVFVTTQSRGTTEPVIRGESFLRDLSASITELSSALNGLGIATPQTAVLLASITASLDNGSPYLSTTLETD